MKKMMMAMMMVMTVSANAMSYNAAKNEALFLSDKMAYELNLTAAQYEAVYEINLDYLMSLNGSGDVFGIWWNRRNTDLRYVLTAWQYERYMSIAHFYRPVAWKAGNWTFAVYSHYKKGHFYNGRPTVYISYKGGNNHKSDRFYADRNVNKPSVSHSSNKPSVKTDNKTWRGNGSASVGSRNHGTPGGRQIAKNSNSSSRSGSGHFGGRR